MECVLLSAVRGQLLGVRVQHLARAQSVELLAHLRDLPVHDLPQVVGQEQVVHHLAASFGVQ